MNKFILIVACFFLTIMVSGCTIVYTTVMDERNVKTIASDTKIKGNILAKFIDDNTIKALDISASCYEGRVYLIGEYETIKQKERAIEIAKNIEGVKTVTTYLLSKKKDGPCGTKVNLKITAKVKAKLVKDKNIWSTNIDIKTMQCIVVLWGLVGSQEEIRKSIVHAKSVEGVKNVKSFLRTAK
ncbi:MAG: BON domain-containing protein [Deltaproteobacteria bacterium]|nr:BON domain-containing protein [Deltaproteobacteria bacterium]MBW1863011.1 BON domain-containing protein [Deltaproteobacteria bacterium]